MPLFLESLRTIAFKLETTPNTAETLTSNDMDIRATDITYDCDFQITEQKNARGNWQRDISIAGKRGVKFTFKIPIYAADATTEPNFSKVLKACSMKHTEYSGTGNGWEVNSEYGNVTATIEVHEKQEGTSPTFLVIKGAGCVGNVKIEAANVGEPAYMSFEFEGKLESVSDLAYGSRIEPSGVSTTTPDAFLNVGVTMFGEGICLNTINFDLQNDVQKYVCPSASAGWVGAHIVDSNPMVTIDADLKTIASSDNYSRITNETTGAFVAQIGDHITLNMPSAQITETYKPGERTGHVVNNLKFEAKRHATLAPFYILQGATS